jgi:hypothetical protein
MRPHSRDRCVPRPFRTILEIRSTCVVANQNHLAIRGTVVQDRDPLLEDVQATTGRYRYDFPRFSSNKLKVD